MTDQEEISIVDFRRIFEAIPGCYLILKPNTPRFTIVAVNDSYAQATKTKREEIIGKDLFNVFPDNPNDPKADGVKNLTASLMRVIKDRKIDRMAVQKYDIPKPQNEGGGFEKRYWSPANSPVFDNDGNIFYIIHHVSDVTQYEKLIQVYGTGQEQIKDFSSGLSQLERLTQIMIERELKMGELKKEIQELKSKG